MISIPVDALEELPGTNPNVMTEEEYAALRESIRVAREEREENPTLPSGDRDLQPILVRRFLGPGPKGGTVARYQVVDGWHRARAHRDLGYPEVEAVVRGEWSEDEARAWRLALNKNRGHLELRRVADELAHLTLSSALPDLPAMTGYAEEEIAELLRAVSARDEVQPVGDLPGELPEEEEPEAAGATLEIVLRDKRTRGRMMRALRKVGGGDLGEGLEALVKHWNENREKD